MSSQIRQIIPPRRQLPSTTWFPYTVGLLHPPLPGLLFHTYLSLGFHFHHEDVALKDVGHLCDLVENKCEGTDAKPTRWPHSLPGCEASPEEWGKTQDAREAAKALERNLTQALVELPALSSTHENPQPRDFRENHFRGEEVKLVKKVGNT